MQALAIAVAMVLLSAGFIISMVGAFSNSPELGMIVIGGAFMTASGIILTLAAKLHAEKKE